MTKEISEFPQKIQVHREQEYHNNSYNSKDRLCFETNTCTITQTIMECGISIAVMQPST